MANPEYKETLDGLDKLGVCLYRIGISLFSLSILLLAGALSGKIEGLIGFTDTALLMIAASAALCAANIHVYSKHVRAAISWSAWIGLALMISDPEQVRTGMSLGFIFITFSGIALKESFCFKVFGLKAVPVLLAISAFAIWFEQPMIASAALAFSSLVMGYLSFAKWRMPLHFDIGIKSNYEV